MDINLLKKIVFMLIVSLFFTTGTATPCSSFTLQNGKTLIFGRNLDESSDIPGFVITNKRGVSKQSVTFKYLLTGEVNIERSFKWESKYGSVTFNNWAVDLPDGGINEKGLFIEEMTLIKTVFPDNPPQKKMFMNQWIQYILDTCESVDEVLQSAGDISLDGWGWHFFIADKTGKSGVIEFLDGKPVMYAGDDLPVPLLCNSTYKKEMDNLKTFEGFGGDKKIYVSDNDIKHRFEKGAYLLKSYNPNKDKSAVDYGFFLLKTITNPKWNKLAKIYDVTNKRIYFYTNESKSIKFINFDSFDYLCTTPQKVLFDIHSDLSGNISNEFINYSYELNLKECFKGMGPMKKDPGMVAYFKSRGTSIDQVILRIAEHMKTNQCTDSKLR